MAKKKRRKVFLLIGLYSTMAFGGVVTGMSFAYIYKAMTVARVREEAREAPPIAAERGLMQALPPAVIETEPPDDDIIEGFYMQIEGITDFFGGYVDDSTVTEEDRLKREQLERLIQDLIARGKELVAEIRDLVVRELYDEAKLKNAELEELRGRIKGLKEEYKRLYSPREY
jgi:hypothetical protein